MVKSVIVYYCHWTRRAVSEKHDIDNRDRAVMTGHIRTGLDSIGLGRRWSARGYTRAVRAAIEAHRIFESLYTVLHEAVCVSCLSDYLVEGRRRNVENVVSSPSIRIATRGNHAKSRLSSHVESGKSLQHGNPVNIYYSQTDIVLGKYHFRLFNPISSVISL